MNINVDNIIGSAAKINNKRNSDKSASRDENNKSIDSVEIGKKVNTRLDSIDSDLKNIQSSLSKNQTIRESLNLLFEEISMGGSKSEIIIKEAKYADEAVLSDLFKDREINESNVRSLIDMTEKNITSDVSKLTKLQIETENIFASNMAGGDQIEKVIKSTETVFLSGGHVSAGNRLSVLNADLVMRLIR
ncbi:MAG: hypothetical protein KA015_00215 [Spirochaetes bacterium]|nr:hypothetical protein [Spirochaetota bacterium]